MRSWPNLRVSASFLDVSARKYIVTRKKVRLNRLMNAKMMLPDVTTAYVAETSAGALHARNQDCTEKSTDCEQPDVPT
jgi:hypothetical protein